MPDVRMVSLGFGKYARSDKIFALEPLTGEQRGDGPAQPGGVDVLDEEAERAGPQAACAVLLAGLARQEQHLRVRVLPHQARRDRHAVQARHADVQHDGVGPERGVARERLLAGPGLVDGGESVDGGEQGREGLADHAVVVDEQQ